MQTVVSVKNPVAIPSLPFHRLAPDLLCRRRRIAGYAEQLVPEGHMLGGENPVHHPRAPVVVDPRLEQLRAPDGLEVPDGGFGVTYEPNPEVHELLLHSLPVRPLRFVGIAARVLRGDARAPRVSPARPRVSISKSGPRRHRTP